MIKILDDFVEEITADFQNKVKNDIYKVEELPIILNEFFKKLLVSLEKKCPMKPLPTMTDKDEKEFHTLSMEALEEFLQASEIFYQKNRNGVRQKLAVASIRAAALYILMSIESIQDVSPLPAKDISESVMKELKEGFKRLGVK